MFGYTGWQVALTPALSCPEPQRQTALVAKQTAAVDVLSQVRLRLGIGWKRTADTWRELGATHLSVNTTNAGLDSPQAHTEAIQRFREVVS